MKHEVKVAIVQHPPVFLNIERSVDRARTLIAEAAAEGAEVIVFPETWLPGYPVWLDAAPGAALWDHPPAKALYRILTENAMAIPGEHLGTLLEAAGDGAAHVVMGAHERAFGTLYNTIVYLNPDGQTYSIHRKLMPTYAERLVWGRGDGRTLDVVTTNYGNLGGLICWEHWMPLARAAMHARHETIHVAQWPWAKELHQIASRHYAFEGQCFVLVAGSVLTKQDVLEGYRSLEVESEAIEMLEQIPGETASYLLKGGSAVIGPDAGYVVEPVLEEACILYADLELGWAVEGHLTLDTDGHYARPDVFHLEVNDEPQPRIAFRSEAGPGKEGS